MKYIYDVLPETVQNILISLYGLKLRNDRFSSCYKKTIKNIDFDLSPTNHELSAHIINFIRKASVDVPFYRTECQEDFPKSSGDLIKNLKKFPIITKNNIQENPELFISERKSGKITTNHTSGSTGSPLNISMCSSSLQINYAFFHKFLSELGLDEFDKSATFAGRLIVPKGRNKPPFWRMNWAMKTLLLSSYHISALTFRDYLSAMESWAPKYIDCYPSTIYELAMFSRQFGIVPNINLKAIVTSSETLFPHQRDLIEDVFRCPVYDYYGCAEQAVFACQLPEEKSSHYRVAAQYCLVEVLDDNNTPVSPGEEGRLVCTNIFNSVMPLIRYDIGDSAVLGSYFENTHFARSLVCVHGRVDDVVKNSKGQKIGRLDPVFKGLSGIKEAQIIQHSLKRLEVRIVKFESCSIDTSKIIKLIKDRVGDDFTIEIRYVSSIPRTSSGKFRAVISKI
jgi:phenylacetate-CoA ligase